MVREVLPHLRATLLALFGRRFVVAVYLVATAGFLQVGSQPPAADWALMIGENSRGIVLNPWAVLAPSIAIGLLAMSVNLAAAAHPTGTPTAKRRTQRAGVRVARPGQPRPALGRRPHRPTP